MIALALLTGGTALLAACSGSSANSGTTSAGGNAAAANGVAGSAVAGSAVGGGAAAPAAAIPSAGSQGAANGSGSAYGKSLSGTGVAARVVSSSAIVYSAELSVRVPDVSAAASTAAELTQAAGGYVSSETAASGPGATADIQLKIPAQVYPATLAQLAGLGTRLSLQRQAEDVTQQVADVNSQVTSDQAAITQLRALLSHAGSVGDLLTVQNQINSEESNLEAIESQQRALNAETSFATVTMTILGPKAKPAPVKHAKPKPPPNLAGGLTAGWRALRITVDWTLAFLGAVAPFLAIAAIAAFATYRTRRWLLHRHPA